MSTVFSTWLVVAGITLGALLIALVAMAVGVMLGRRPISGSCGGIASQTDAEGNSSCALCSNPSETCRRLAEKMDKNHV